MEREDMKLFQFVKTQILPDNFRQISKTRVKQFARFVCNSRKQ